MGSKGKALQFPVRFADVAPVGSQDLCECVVLECWNWKSMRFFVRRWSISSLKQPSAASARLASFGGASVVAISAMRWEKGLWVTGSIPIPDSFFFSLVFQWFFTSLSVRPGSCAAIKDHL